MVPRDFLSPVYFLIYSLFSYFPFFLFSLYWTYLPFLSHSFCLSSFFCFHPSVILFMSLSFYVILYPPLILCPFLATLLLFFSAFFCFLVAYTFPSSHFFSWNFTFISPTTSSSSSPVSYYEYVPSHFSSIYKSNFPFSVVSDRT
jgi:hypothetical protein